LKNLYLAKKLLKENLLWIKFLFFLMFSIFVNKIYSR
jgi:hypothetical protein